VGCIIENTSLLLADKRQYMSGLFRKVDCHSLPVDDLDEALDFYQTKLGHELIWRSDSAAGMRIPESSAELVLHTAARPIETDFTVESVPDAIKVFTEAGGEVMVDIFDISIGKCAVLRDPWGNEIIILDNSKGLLQVDEGKNVIK
jgi:predicted enzyme related to lactoylglutathione lyase